MQLSSGCYSGLAEIKDEMQKIAVCRSLDESPFEREQVNECVLLLSLCIYLCDI